MSCVWRRLAPNVWVAIEDAQDYALPPDLLVPGHIVLTGVGVMDEDGLKMVLLRLDHCHAQPDAFTICTGGLYCSERILFENHPESSPEYPKVDCLLPRGFHTQFMNDFGGRPLFAREARDSALSSQSVIGYVSRCLQNGHMEPWQGDVQKLPPMLLHAVQLVAQGCGRRQRRLLRQAIFFWDPFDDISLRHLCSECKT